MRRRWLNKKCDVIPFAPAKMASPQPVPDEPAVDHPELSTMQTVVRDLDQIESAMRKALPRGSGTS